MTARINPDHIAILLAEPQIPENIGATARAMSNMGLKHLILIRPGNLDLPRIRKMATGNSMAVVDRMTVVGDLKEATGPFNYVAGTTARIGSNRPALNRPRDLAQQLIPLSPENRIAILFGPEDRGLSNAQLRYCHTIVTIPTAGFSSLNLAQAVLIICYEIAMAARKRAPAPVPRLANRFELEGMYDHIRDVCMKIGFIDPQNPEHWMLNIRRFLSRMPLRAREVRIIRGLCRQVDWYTRQLDKLKKGGKGDEIPG